MFYNSCYLDLSSEYGDYDFEVMDQKLCLHVLVLRKI